MFHRFNSAPIRFILRQACAGVALFALLPINNLRANIIYATSGTSLYTIDPNTAATSLVGSHNLVGDSIVDITFDNNGTLYGASGTGDHIVSIDMNSGQLNNFTPPNSAGTGAQLRGLEFDSNDSLFSTGTLQTGVLWEVNTVTGVAYTVGLMGLPQVDSSMNYIAFDENDVLYGANFLTGELFTVDTNTGNALLVGNTGYIGLSGITFNSNGDLFGFEAVNGNLLIIDTLTASASVIGSTGLFGIKGIAYFGQAAVPFVPEPSAFELLGIACVGVGLSSRRFRVLNASTYPRKAYE